jgi:DNA-directed RNA polymerase subunit RPC12/RpoP
MKCPECKANLSVEEGRKYCFCQYCGTKIMLEDDRVNKTYYTYRNEARLRQAEIDREIALKKLEIEKIKVEQEEKRKNKNRRLKIIVAIILAILVFVLSLSGYLLKDGSLTLTAMMIFPILCILGITSLGNNDKK